MNFRALSLMTKKSENWKNFLRFFFFNDRSVIAKSRGQTGMVGVRDADLAPADNAGRLIIAVMLMALLYVYLRQLLSQRRLAPALFASHYATQPYYPLLPI